MHIGIQRGQFLSEDAEGAGPRIFHEIHEVFARDPILAAAIVGEEGD
jgi:hypothetical protein